MRPTTAFHHRFWILLYIITSVAVVAVQCTSATKQNQHQWQRQRRSYSRRAEAVAGLRGEIGQTTERGDNGPSQVVLNATLQLNADDNSGEQIIRIRDKDQNAVREDKGAKERTTTSTTMRSSTLLDNEHQRADGGDRGAAKVNLHGTDTIVNISSSQVGARSGSGGQVSLAAEVSATTARPHSLKSTSTSSTSTTHRPSEVSDDHLQHHHPHEHHRHQHHHQHSHQSENHQESDEVDSEDESGDADDQDDDDGDEVDEGEERDVEELSTRQPIKVETTSASNLRKTVVVAGDGKANSVINGNYKDSNASSQPLGKVVETTSMSSSLPTTTTTTITPTTVHRSTAEDNVMNIERAIGENGEQMIIIAGEDDDEVVNVHKNHLIDEASLMASQHKSDPAEEPDSVVDEPIALPLRPIIRDPYDEMDDEARQEEMTIVYAELHSEVTINCEVDMDIHLNTWFHDGQMIHPIERRGSRPAPDIRFIKESRGALTIGNVMAEDNGKWTCEAVNSHGYEDNARPVKLVVLDRPKAPYLLIDSRRLDAGNIFIPVKENSELSLACVSEGGNPKPVLTWEILLSPGVDRHAQKISHELTHLEEVKKEVDKDPYKINSGSISEVKLPVVYRAHHNARILCVMEHPTLKVRLNASLLLDVQYTPSFAISRTPGFGYPLREGIAVSLKCDVDSNPSSTPIWQKDDGDPPVPQAGDGYLNFTSIKREHSGWYKCTARHLNFQYTSIGYYLSVRYDSVDVTSEPIEPDMSMSSAAQHMYKTAQMEVQLGGAVTLQCPQGSLGCWSQLDPNSNRLRGLGAGLSMPTGQSMLKDVVYQDGGIYKCIGQNPSNKKKMEVLHTVAVAVKGPPTAVARNATPIAHPGSPLHLYVEFCANPPAFAARWLHGDRIYTPGNQYGVDVLAYAVQDLPTPFCKEARLTYVRMHERVQRTFSFIVSSPGGVAEAIFKVNFTVRHKTMSNSVDETDEEELREPEEIHFPDFGSSHNPIIVRPPLLLLLILPLLLVLIRERNGIVVRNRPGQ